MSNTCTIDNFLYLLFILIQHNENVRLWFQQEATEKPTAATILRVAALFAGGRWAAGKLEWIRENIESSPGRGVNLFGTEHEFFVIHYGELQLNATQLRCSNETCPAYSAEKRTSGEVILR